MDGWPLKALLRPIRRLTWRPPDPTTSVARAAPDGGSIRKSRLANTKSAQSVFLGMLCCLLAFVAPAQARPQEPVIVVNPKPVNPQDFPWIGESGVKALANEIAAHNSGSVFAFVFAGSPYQAWAFTPASKQAFVSIGELARRTLQVCEYSNNGVPCFILSINGYDTHDANGNLPDQPELLAGLPGTFDAARVPFLTNHDQSQLAEYARAARPRALVITTSGWWSWATGNDLMDAISKEEAACQKHSKTDTCLLYAVNGEIVFTPPGHATPPVRAQGWPPRPVIVSNPNPVDPKDFPWLAPQGASALASDIAQQKSGSISAFVFAASKSNHSWADAQASKTDVPSIEDLARIALQDCEFINSGAPCFILSINGKDGRDAAGSLPVQPAMLANLPPTFDVARVPFVWNEDRGNLGAYEKLAEPRAMVLSLNAWSDWETGKTLLDAIAKAQAACQKENANNRCLLYAVNDQVVFSPSDH